MSYISGARSVADEQVRIASTKMDGIGPKKAIQVQYRLGISGNIKIKELTKYQIDQIEQIIGQDHVFHWELKRGERADIERLISISRYHGICHQDMVNELILMLGLVANKFGNERSLPKALGTCLINHTDSFNSSLIFFLLFLVFHQLLIQYTYSRPPSKLH